MSPDAFDSAFLSLARVHARRRAIAKRRNIDNCFGSVKQNAVGVETVVADVRCLAGQILKVTWFYAIDGQL